MIRIDETRCVHRMANLARCDACVRACPRAAWTMQADGLAFDPQRCDDCLLCLSACPTQALRAPPDAPAVAAPDAEVLRLACALAAPEDTHPNVLPCVHMADEYDLLRWHAAGVRRILTTTQACAACRRRPAVTLRQRLQRVNQALESRAVPGGPSPLNLETTDRWRPPDLPAPATATKKSSSLPAAGRRALLGLRGLGPAGLASGDGRAAPSAGQQGPAAGQPVRAAMFHAARLEAALLLRRHGEGLALWAVKLDAARCDACTACARLCPTQAIELAGDAARPEALHFDMGRCIGCALCVDVCEPRALAPAGGAAVLGASSAPWRVALGMATCTVCGRGFRIATASGCPAPAVCPLCRCTPRNREGRIVQDNPP